MNRPSQLSKFLQTAWNSRAYNLLLATPQLVRATGERVQVRLRSVQPWLNGTKARHSFIAHVEGMGYDAIGIGASEFTGEAIHKSISESYERLVYNIVRGPLGLKSSNGIAAHPKRKTAIENAATEALERDAVLVHWLRKQPLYRLPVDPETEPRKIIDASLAGTPFHTKHLLLSSAGWISTLTIVAEEYWGGGAIVAHGSGKNPLQALYRTVIELERQAATVRDLLPHNPGLLRAMHPLLDHLTFSRERLRKADWLVGDEMSWSQAKRQWRSLDKRTLQMLQIQDLAEGGLHVVRASGSRIQDLYFGPTKLELINQERIHSDSINYEPHYVA
jgi:hypothetical protein